MKGFLVVLGITTIAPIALADETCDEATAATHFQEAKRLYFEVKDYARAASEFEAANQCKPAAEALYGAGIARFAAGDLLRAARELDDAIHAGIRPQDEAIARAKLAAIDGKVGHLEIVGPAGARVVVDDQPETSVPARVRVLPGDHTIVSSVEHRRASVAAGGSLRVDVSPNAQPIPEPPPQAHGVPVLRVVGLIAIGVGVATLGAGWITSYVGSGINDRYNSARTSALHDQALAYQTAYDVLFIAGGVIAATGLVLTLLPAPKAHVTVGLSGVMLDARF